MHGWAIPQDNRMAHQKGANKTTENCLDLLNSGSFDKFTGEHMNKKSLYFFCLVGVYL